MTNRRYTFSKGLYAVLLSVSVIVDASLAISLYDWLKDLLGDIYARCLLLSASIGLGIILYLLYMWQMEHLTSKK